MTQLTVESRNPSGQMVTEAFDIVRTFESGFNVKRPKGTKVYAAVRTRECSDFVRVLADNGRIVAQGMMAE